MKQEWYTNDEWRVGWLGMVGYCMLPSLTLSGVPGMPEGFINCWNAVAFRSAPLSSGRIVPRVTLVGSNRMQVLDLMS